MTAPKPTPKQLYQGLRNKHCYVTMMESSRRKMASGVYPDRELIKKAMNNPACQTKGKNAVRKVSPKKVSPKRVSPKKVSPKYFSRVVTTGIPAKRVSPKKITPQRVSPKRVSPKRVSPKRITPQRVSPKRITPQRVSPKRVSPKKVASPKKKKSRGIPVKKKVTIVGLPSKPKSRKRSAKKVSPRSPPPPPSHLAFASSMTQGQQTSNRLLANLISRIENREGAYGRPDYTVFKGRK